MHRNLWSTREQTYHQRQKEYVSERASSFPRISNPHCHSELVGFRKLTLHLTGQGNYREARATRQTKPIDDDEALRWVCTIRGRTGAVAAMVPIRNEAAEDSCLFIYTRLSCHSRRKPQGCSLNRSLFEFGYDNVCPNSIVEHMCVCETRVCSQLLRLLWVVASDVHVDCSEQTCGVLDEKSYTELEREMRGCMSSALFQPLALSGGR